MNIINQLADKLQNSLGMNNIVKEMMMKKLEFCEAVLMHEVNVDFLFYEKTCLVCCYADGL